MCRFFSRVQSFQLSLYVPVGQRNEDGRQISSFLKKWTTASSHPDSRKNYDEFESKPKKLRFER